MSFGIGISWSYTTHRQGFWPRINCSQMKLPDFESPSGDSLSKSANFGLAKWIFHFPLTKLIFMATWKPNLWFLGLVDWELCLLEVVQFCGPLLAILTPVQWCQVTHRNKIYTHHILPHIGHWWPFGNNWWSTISSPSFRSFLGVNLTHLIKPSVQCYLWKYFQQRLTDLFINWMAKSEWKMLHIL